MKKRNISCHCRVSNHESSISGVSKLPPAGSIWPAASFDSAREQCIDLSNQQPISYNPIGTWRMELYLHSFSSLLTLWIFARVVGFCLCSVQHSNSAAALVVSFVYVICYHSKSFGCRDVLFKTIFSGKVKRNEGSCHYSWCRYNLRRCCLLILYISLVLTRPFGARSLEYLLSGPFLKTFADPCSSP